MNILQLCKKFPYPLKDGESIAVHQMSRALNEAGCKVSLLAMNTSKHYVHLNEIDQEVFSHYKEVFTVDVDNKIYVSDAIKNLFSSDSFHISRFISETYANKLKEILQHNKFDIIQLETPYLTPYLEIIKSLSQAVVVMRAHNIEHEIWERIVENIRFIPYKWYLSYLSKKLKRFEVNSLNEYDLLVAITERDMIKFKSLGYKNGCISSPVSFDSNQYLGDYSSYERPLSVSFIGSLDWIPNRQGLQWFLKVVWPEIFKVHPALSFHFAGRNAPAELSSIEQAGVVFHSEVIDAQAFINDHCIMVVPLFAASGMRVKILEAMALGRVVISTSIGLEGIPAVHYKHVIIANNAIEFKEAIEWCVLNQSALKLMGKAAASFVKQEFDNSSQAKKLLAAYQYTLRQHSTH